MQNVQKNKILYLFAALLFAALIFSAFIGAAEISFSQIFDFQDPKNSILFFIRLPRILLAIIVGAALASCGAALQALFKNPLADPALIGISSGAAFFVALAIVIFQPLFGDLTVFSISFFAFFGSLASCFVVFYFAKSSQSFSMIYMLLAGIAVNAICGSATGLLTYFSTDQQLRALSIWGMGNLGSAMWDQVFICLVVVLICVFVLIKKAQKLDIFLLGEDEARYLGVNVEKLKITVIICVCLSVGVCVAVSGIIGFVGLVVPHLIRLLFGAGNKFLIPASAFLGAILLLLADDISRTILAPAEIPVGIITSAIGGPFFLWLLVKQYKKIL